MFISNLTRGYTRSFCKTVFVDWLFNDLLKVFIRTRLFIAVEELT
ncbi:hypothetical protein PROFUN_12521 [Planoprotostelium fungivorum]|uniref:Uncharacterized protein n=1 Tax=Planoprotostelium fungivorum TaxID=1890364 RepID=A0A2P6MS36_9EUKA|nr:hypothetical protein PROFUN_12521 [Planoprotostelium fungivorum]